MTRWKYEIWTTSSRSLLSLAYFETYMTLWKYEIWTTCSGSILNLAYLELFKMMYIKLFKMITWWLCWLEPKLVVDVWSITCNDADRAPWRRSSFDPTFPFCHAKKTPKYSKPSHSVDRSSRQTPAQVLKIHKNSLIIMKWKCSWMLGFTWTIIQNLSNLKIFQPHSLNRQCSRNDFLTNYLNKQLHKRTNLYFLVFYEFW